MQHINLETFANGAFTAQVNRAIEEVTKNIQDPNTDAGTARKITVTIAFKPNQERNFIATGVQTKTTLAPALGAVTALSMGKDLRTGEVEAVRRSATRFQDRCLYRTFRELYQKQELQW